VIDAMAVQEFLFEEAALADASDGAGWLELWAPDGTYYAPANDDDADTRLHVALLNEDHAGLVNRVHMLGEGLVHAQTPGPRTSRMIGNIRVSAGEDGLVVARAVFTLTAFRRHTLDHFAGRLVYRLRPEGASFRIVRKEIYLVNNDGYLPNMTFLL
jgi:3-phenylpropionate/cinnamic acid dioxygenase small subunit